MKTCMHDLASYCASCTCVCALIYKAICMAWNKNILTSTDSKKNLTKKQTKKGHRHTQHPHSYMQTESAKRTVKTTLRLMYTHTYMPPPPNTHVHARQLQRMAS
eukprot:GDKI01022275.1.p1 GENE.GDKI01022275.1~~GDKI01022275.1.p1  ORF type:complete len:104 (+),score=18.34 GDKI01022275.1:113-424(+)